MQHGSALSRFTLAVGVVWTVGAYGAIQLLRFATNVVLARLLSPELFGIMFLVNSIRTGMELVSDLGIGQNIVHNKNGDCPEFYNTAWSLQILRGLILWASATALSFPVASLYQIPILTTVLPVAAFYFVLTGCASVAVPLMHRRMQLKQFNAFELICEVFSSIAHIIFAYLSPTIWSLILGGLAYGLARTIGSYFLISNIQQRFVIISQYVWQIVSFGKWILISSIVFFLSMNFDRLYLGKAAALSVLGVYGIARTMSDILATTVQRLGNLIIFPFIASSQAPRQELRNKIVPSRTALLMAAALGLSVVATTGDWVVYIFYDARYQSAGWMFPLLVIGTWFAILSNINESILLGLGKPVYSAAANSSKFIWLLVALPVGYISYGVVGAVVIVALGDLFRYIPLIVGQTRERFSFLLHDLSATVMVFGLIAIGAWIRWYLGFGTSLDGLRMT
jgi:O-antigen/teichoic acid export membrane protein